jgi:FdhD protein
MVLPMPVQSANNHPSGVRPVEVIRSSSSNPGESCWDKVAEEEPLEIRVGGESIAVTMRTPGQDEELAAGFLYCEGILRRREDLVAFGHCRKSDPDEAQNIFNLHLAPGVGLDREKLARHFFASSSCGICGRASIEAVRMLHPPAQSEAKVAAALLSRLPRRLLDAQGQFRETGGLHASALFDLEGNLLLAREDVGRHNAVDKIVGRGFLDETLPYEDKLLLVSGRASFEIMQKALAAGIALVAAISAPSSLAVEFAREHGQTLIGFLREGRFNIYSNVDRVVFGGADE